MSKPNPSFLAAFVFFCGFMPIHAAPLLQEKKIEAPADAVPESANRHALFFLPTVNQDLRSKLPLVIYLHGAGSKGSDHVKPHAEPLAKWLLADETQQKFPSLVLIPQCKDGEESQGRPNNWVNWENQRGTKPVDWKKSDREPTDQLRGAMALLDVALQNELVDPTRVYLVGMSMGGSAAWNWSAREPCRFAAIVTVCGLSEVERAAPLGKLPIRTFHGAKDAEVPVERTRAMAAVLQKQGSDFKYTEYPDGGHGIAKQVIAEPGLLEWLFKQRKVEAR